jgi:ankyrin repeat protein
MVFLSHDHRTALMYAAENASATVIDTLLAAGASPNDRDTQGLAPIDYFQCNPIHNGPDGARVSAALAPTNKH